MIQIDLNADLGEGFGRWQLGDDDALLEVITSANVACGFHAGDPMIMRHVCRQALQCGVAVGAQVSYRDLAGFGRRPMTIDPEELTGDVIYQIGGLDACARAEGTRVSYVKAHGALNNVSAVDAGQAGAIVAAVLAVDPGLPILVQPGSQLQEHAQAAGLTVVTEAYPDRAYDSHGRLVSRNLPGAVLHDVEIITRRAVRLATRRSIQAQDGTERAIDARSLCLHGDNPASVTAARSVAEALRAHGVTVVGFAGGD